MGFFYQISFHQGYLLIQPCENYCKINHKHTNAHPSLNLHMESMIYVLLYVHYIAILTY
jgi:hypothetical protein